MRRWLVMPLGYLSSARQSVAFWVMLAMFLGFLTLSLLVRSPGLTQRDAMLTRAIQHWRTPGLDSFFRAVTFLGDPIPPLLVAALASAWLFRMGQQWPGVFVLISTAGLPLNFLIKELIRRPRPAGDSVNVLLDVVGRSFPSGHAMTATMVYGFLAYLGFVLPARPLHRALLVALFTILPLLIGFSRVYLGVHWASDILGGWTAGLFFLFLMVLAYRLVTAV
ncbi:MAG TPA: phosphatase PAP2 family protein [Candidatus Eisenbacteria bacterium]